MTTPDITPARPADRRLLRWLLLAFATVVALVAIVPLVIPISPAGEGLEPRALADPDSQFADTEGVTLHYKEWGSEEASHTVVLLHGFGASTFSWSGVGPALAARGYRVIAIDRTGFGLTQRPVPPFGGWSGGSPYSFAAQADQASTLLTRLGVKRATVVGHSQGAGTAVLVAARHPDQVDGLVLTAPAVEVASLNGVMRALLATPQARRIGPLAVRRIARPASDDLIRDAYSDPAHVTPEVIEGYRKPLRARDWDLGLWEQTIAYQPDHPANRLEKVRDNGLPVLVVLPLDDRLVQVDRQLTTAEALGAQEQHVAGGGHVFHEEYPERFTEMVVRFLEGSVYPTTGSEPCDESG